jgi:hypothetical protein
MTNAKPFRVSPSQLPEFKQVANELSNKISELSGQNKLSAFQRNDCLARGLGYKGHSDLVQSSKARQDSDPTTHHSVGE